MLGSKHLHFLSFLNFTFWTKHEIAIWKTNNCETAVTVIVFIFSYRWHQIMCYICQLIIKFLCFILVKLSVKRPDKLTLLTHFKSLVIQWVSVFFFSHKTCRISVQYQQLQHNDRGENAIIFLPTRLFVRSGPVDCRRIKHSSHLIRAVYTKNG